MTLDEAVRLTVETNPERLGASADRRAADHAVERARAGFYPDIDLRAAAGVENSKNVSTINRADRGLDGSSTVTKSRGDSSLSMRQMLFDGFEVESAVSEQKARRDSTAHRVRETSESLGLEAAQTYLDLLEAGEQVNLAAANVALHQTFVQQTLSRAQAGAGRFADVRQAEGRLALAHSTLLVNEGALRDAQARFLRVVGARPEALVRPVLAESIVPDALDVAIGAALANNPALARVASDVATARWALEGAAAPFYPRLDLEFNATRNRDLDGVDGPNEDATALVVLNYNLYRGGEDTAREREAGEQLASALADEQRIRRLVEEEVRLAWNDLMTSRQRLEPLRAHVGASEQVVRSYKQQFDIGQRSLLDVLDTEDELFRARAALVTGEFDALFGAYRLLASAGLLLDSLQVTVPAEAFPSR